MLRYFSTKSTSIESVKSSMNFDGLWRNELSSEMELKVDKASGNVTGVYRTGVGTPQPTEDFKLVGFAAGDLLSFTVNFGKYGSLTSWSGQSTFIDGATVIETMWLMAENVPDADEPSKLWSAMLTGADNFRR